MLLATKLAAKAAKAPAMPLNVRVSLDLMNALKAATKTADISLSDLVRVALEREIAFRTTVKSKRVVTLEDIDARLEKIHDMQFSALTYQRTSADLQPETLAMNKEVLGCLYPIMLALGISPQSKKELYER